MPQSLKEGRHYRVREDFSQRQREVLNLLVKGRTNREIAEELGISLDGAKYHVSEVITKLGVDSREEAAEWWRQQQGLRARLRVLTRGLSAPAALRWVGMGGGAVVLVGVIAVVAVTMSQDGGSEPEPVQHSPTAVATEPAGTPAADDGGPADNGQPGVPLSEIGGVPVRELRIGDEVDLPAGSVLYYNVTCYACGPGLDYHRAYINGEGQLIQEPLSPFFPQGNLHSLTIRPNSSTMLLHMCTGGYCQQGWSLDEGTTPHTYVSVDGGVTWSQSTPPLPLLSWILGFHQDGWLVRTLSSIHEGFSHDDPLWVYPSGQVLTQPPSHPKSWAIAFR